MEVLNCEKLYPSIQTVTNKLFRRDLIKDIAQLPILIEDEPTIAQYLARCKKIVTTSDSYYFYRAAPESLSNPSFHRVEYWENFFNDYKLYFDILQHHFNNPIILRKQTVLRHRSMLRRIYAYHLL